MSQAYIADAVRTPVGKRGGALSAVHPADLAAEAIAATLRRNDVDPARVDGCCCLISRFGAVRPGFRGES